MKMLSVVLIFSLQTGHNALSPLDWSKNDIVAAVGTGTRCHLVRADVNGVIAGAVDFFLGEEAVGSFSVFAAGWAFDDEFRHE